MDMKTKIATTIALITCVLLLNSETLFAQTKKSKKKLQTLELKISGMTCEDGCAKGIESSVYKIKGVKKSIVNFDTQTATFIFDTTKTNKEEIIKKIESFNPEKEEGRRYVVTFVSTK